MIMSKVPRGPVAGTQTAARRARTMQTAGRPRKDEERDGRGVLGRWPAVCALAAGRRTFSLITGAQSVLTQAGEG